VEDDGTLTLLWTETTSSGQTLEEIGKFNTHANELIHPFNMYEKEDDRLKENRFS